MLASMLALCLMGQPQPDRPTRVAFVPISAGSYSAWIYSTPKYEPWKSPNPGDELDKLLAQFEKGPNAVRVNKRRW